MKGDVVFKRVVRASAFSILLILGIMLAGMVMESLPALGHNGWRFIAGKDWDPVQEHFGVLPYLYGTVISSLLAVLVATPLSVGTALCITEILPPRLGSVVSVLIELLAAIPSVIYGLWGILVMAPWLQDTLQPLLIDMFGFTPFFQGAPYGVSMMAAVLILAIMIVPIITALSREVLLAVPQSQKEAAWGLGATRWEMIRMAVLPGARSGIMGAVILGLGRAIGETMAVTMVIGNTPQMSLSLLAPAYTMPSVIANEFAETTSKLHAATLMETGLLLLVATLLVNVLARLMILGVAGKKWGVS